MSERRVPAEIASATCLKTHFSMKKSLISLAATFAVASSASAATLAGVDFSDSAVFNAAGGNYDNSAGSVDDIDLTDTITVTTWSFANGGSLIGFDANAQVGMPNDNVTKFNGINNSSGVAPAIGSSGAAFGTHSFSLNIPAGTTLDLDSVTFDYRKATTSGNLRWIAFDTSEDSGIIFSDLGVVRNGFESANIDLSGATYQGLTGSVTFNWYTGGQGSGDIDVDTIIISGTQNIIPEPSATLLSGLAALGLVLRRRRR